MRAKYSKIETLNEKWADALAKIGRKPFASFEDLSILTKTEEVDRFFEHTLEYSQMGQDYFGWLNGSLLRSVFAMDTAASDVFHTEGSGFEHIPLANKSPECIGTH